MFSRVPARLIVAIAVGLVFSASWPSAFSQTTPKQAAERHYQTAVRLFGEGRYREALDEFDAAIEISPESIFYCNRAIVLIKLREQEQALRSLELCRKTFEGEAAELAQIDAQARAVSAFVHHIRPRALTITGDIASGPVVQRTREIEPAWSPSDFGYLSLGAGGALLATAAVVDWLSADLRDEFIRESRGGPGTSEQRYLELEDEVQTRKTLFLSLAIGGGVLAATGVTLLIWDFSMDSSLENEGSSITPIVDPLGRYAGFRGHW